MLTTVRSAPPDTLTDTQVALAQKALEKFVEHTPVELAVVSGSIAFGLAHAMSDIDLYVVTEDAPRTAVAVTHIGDVTVQFNRLSRGDLHELAVFATPSAEPLSRANRRYIVADTICKDAIRLAGGRVIHSTGESGTLLRTFDWDFLARRMMSREAIVATQFLEDLYGALQVRDLDTAVLTSRMLAAQAAEVVLASARDLYVGPKFVGRRLRRWAHLGPLIGQLLEALDLDPEDAALTAATARRIQVERLADRGGLAAFAIALAHLDGWSDALRHAPAHLADTCGPLRAPGFTTMRFDDGIGLAGMDRGFSVSESAARIWLSLDGRRSVRQLVAANPEWAEPIATLERLGVLVGGRGRR